MKELNELRDNIDKIDNEIIALIKQRARNVKEIGALKKTQSSPVFSNSREISILRKIEALADDSIDAARLKDIYREILSALRSLEGGVKVAFLGPEATFTQQAATKYFGKYIDYAAQRTITDVFYEVEKQRVDFGVVPIENSNEGAVNHTLDMLVESDLNIIGELYLRIHLNLLARPKTQMIEKIFAHPQTIGQSRRFLEEKYKDAAIIEMDSTARAAEEALNTPNSAAIASSLAAQIFNLEVLEKNIEDSTKNFTRFFVLAHNYKSRPTGKDKSTIAFSVKDEVGILYKMLRPFYENNINLTKIESRPDKKKIWEYVFFVDFLGHFEDDNVKAALRELEKKCIFLKRIGSYPAGEIHD